MRLVYIVRINPDRPKWSYKAIGFINRGFIKRRPQSSSPIFGRFISIVETASDMVMLSGCPSPPWTTVSTIDTGTTFELPSESITTWRWEKYSFHNPGLYYTVGDITSTHTLNQTVNYTSRWKFSCPPFGHYDLYSVIALNLRLNSTTTNTTRNAGLHPYFAVTRDGTHCTLLPLLHHWDLRRMCGLHLRGA